MEDGSVREGYNVDDHFVGQRRDRLAPSFRVSCNLYEGYFVAIRPADGDSRPADGDSRLVWIATQNLIQIVTQRGRIVY
jgi:hypothetical protein